MVKKVVPGGQHHASIQHHQVAKGFRFINCQLLKRRLLFVQLLLHLQGKCGSLILEYLGEPIAVQRRHGALLQMPKTVIKAHIVGAQNSQP